MKNVIQGIRANHLVEPQLLGALTNPDQKVLLKLITGISSPCVLVQNSMEYSLSSIHQSLLRLPSIFHMTNFSTYMMNNTGFFVPQFCYQMMFWPIRSANTNVNRGYVKIGRGVFHQTRIFLQYSISSFIRLIHKVSL